MKRHLSVLMLLARSSIYKLLGLFAGLTAAEALLFWLTLRRAGSEMSLEAVLAGSRVVWVFALAFLLTVLVLCRTGSAPGSCQAYTLRRLAVSERTVFIWQCAYNTAGFFLLWAVQGFAALLLCRLYLAQADPAMTSGQTLFLAFYRSPFLHSLLPLEALGRWLRNGVLALCLGVTAACFPLRRRQGKWGVGVLLLAAVTLFRFVNELGARYADLWTAVWALVLTAGAVLLALCWEEDEDAA